MKSDLRPKTINSLLSSDFGSRKRIVVAVDAELDGATEKVLTRAVKKAGRGGVVDLGVGEFEGFSVDRHVEISSRSPGLTEISGTITTDSGPSLFLGLTLRPPEGQPAVKHRSGTAIFQDCSIYGPVEVGVGAKVYLKNCCVVTTGVAISLREGGLCEVMASRITGSPAGILLEKGAVAALYGCRVEECHGSGESATGAGIFASFADVYAEGCEFFQNDVGVYLKSCGETTLAANHFYRNSIAGLITETALPNRALKLIACTFDAPEGAACSPVALHGGSVLLSRCDIESPDLAALAASQSGLRIEHSLLKSRAAPALDAQGGSFLASQTRFESLGAAGIHAEESGGEIHGGCIIGQPPIADSDPPRVRYNGVLQTETPPPSPDSGGGNGRSPDSLEACLSLLDGIIGQSAAKDELSRLVHLAFAARQRRPQNLAPGELNFSGMMMGPHGTGKGYAARIFARALHSLGELPTDSVQEIALSEAVSLAPDSVSDGILLIRMGSDGVSLATPGVVEALILLARGVSGRAHVMVDGEKNELQAAVRTRADLSREYPIELNFVPFGPPELAALFQRHCKDHGIPVSPDAARTLIVIMHGLHDRLHRRFTDTDGIIEFFNEAHRNYLERCSRLQRFDLELESGDIVVPLDRTTSAILERSADLIATCPACGAENPWLPGLAPSFHCLHCDQPFTAPFGTLRTSSSAPQKRSVIGKGLRTGAVAMRRTITAALRSRAGV